MDRRHGIGVLVLVGASALLVATSEPSFTAAPVVSEPNEGPSVRLVDAEDVRVFAIEAEMGRLADYTVDLSVRAEDEPALFSWELAPCDGLDLQWRPEPVYQEQVVGTGAPTELTASLEVTDDCSNCQIAVCLILQTRDSPVRVVWSAVAVTNGFESPVEIVEVESSPQPDGEDS